MISLEKGHILKKPKHPFVLV